jgi:hypothetical protein
MCQQRDALIAKVKRAARAFAGDQSAHLWDETLRALHGGAWDTAAETAVITALGVGVSSGLEGRERASAPRALDEAVGAALHLLRDSVEHGAPAAREAKRLGDDRKRARKLFKVWGELAARAGPRASSILAEGRRHIMTRAGPTRQGSIVGRFPKKIINLAYFGQVPFGYVYICVETIACVHRLAGAIIAAVSARCGLHELTYPQPHIFTLNIILAATTRTPASVFGVKITRLSRSCCVLRC